MPKVFGVHIVELRAGVAPAFFEEFVIGRFLPALPLAQTPGVKAYFLKADRGERDGKYLWMFEFDDVATRDRYFPQHNHVSPELKALLDPLHEVAEIWSDASERTKTDYVVLAEGP